MNTYAVCIETDALPVNAARIATEALGYGVSASQAGRLGAEVNFRGTRDESRKVAKELRAHGYRVWQS